MSCANMPTLSYQCGQKWRYYNKKISYSEIVKEIFEEENHSTANTGADTAICIAEIEERIESRIRSVFCERGHAKGSGGGQICQI